MNEVGQEIRRLRTEKGWSQAQLAVYAGSSQPTVNQIETGARNPSASTLQKIATALGVEVGDLFPKEESSSLDPRLFDGLEDELRYKLEVVESGVQYIIARAEYWKQELERGSTKEYATYTAARNLSALAIEEFSSFNGWLFGVVAADLNSAIASGEAPAELADEHDALIDKFVEHIIPIQHMLLDNANRLAETEAQRDDLAKIRKTTDASVKERRSA